MAFHIDPGGSVQAEFRRIAAEQFEAAIEELADPSPDEAEEAVHDARKRCKRLRALFRLTRPAMGERRYRSLDTAVRDAARELSTTRDAAALVAMFDDLVAAHGANPDDEGLRLARTGFVERVAALEADEGEAGNPMRRARERLEVAAGVAAGAKFDANGFGGIRGGLATTYQEGAKALARLRKTGASEDSHDWRKAVKYSWHHLELLEDTAPSMLTPAAKHFHAVADALGDAHNLAVMVEVVSAAPASFGGDEVAATLVRMATESAKDLENRAIRLGLRLYTEAPAAYTRRLHGYWKAARRAGEELPAGELAEVTPKPASAPPAEAEAKNLLLVGQ